VCDHTPAVLVLVGSFEDAVVPHLGLCAADYQQYLLDLIRRLDLCKHVRLLPGRDRAELPSLYAAADLFVNLTVHHDENFGLAQVEALACGVPVVGTHWGGLRDTVRNGVTGVSIPAIPDGRGNPSAVARGGAPRSNASPRP
jgi:glycosyltransferase involved in cell wall biosynthesis